MRKLAALAGRDRSGDFGWCSRGRDDPPQCPERWACLSRWCFERGNRPRCAYARGGHLCEGRRRFRNRNLFIGAISLNEDSNFQRCRVERRATVARTWERRRGRGLTQHRDEDGYQPQSEYHSVQTQQGHVGQIYLHLGPGKFSKQPNSRGVATRSISHGTRKKFQSAMWDSRASDREWNFSTPNPRFFFWACFS